MSKCVKNVPKLERLEETTSSPNGHCPSHYFFGGTLVKIFICRNFSLSVKKREGKPSVATGRNSKSRHMHACISEPQRPTISFQDEVTNSKV